MAFVSFSVQGCCAPWCMQTAPTSFLRRSLLAARPQFGPGTYILLFQDAQYFKVNVFWDFSFWDVISRDCANALLDNWIICLGNPPQQQKQTRESTDNEGFRSHGLVQDWSWTSAVT